MTRISIDVNGATHELDVPPRLLLAQMSQSVPDPLGQLSQIYADAVTTTSRPAFAAATELLGHGRILFGTDYPYVAIEATLGGLRELRLEPDTLDAIARGNAVSLLDGRAP